MSAMLLSPGCRHRVMAYDLTNLQASAAHWALPDDALLRLSRTLGQREFDRLHVSQAFIVVAYSHEHVRMRDIDFGIVHFRVVWHHVLLTSVMIASRQCAVICAAWREALLSVAESHLAFIPSVCVCTVIDFESLLCR